MLFSRNDQIGRIFFDEFQLVVNLPVVILSGSSLIAQNGSDVAKLFSHQTALQTGFC